MDSSNRLHFLWTPVWAHPELQEDALSKPDPRIIVPLPDQDFGPSQVADLIQAAYWKGWEDAKREEDHNDRTDVRQLAEPGVTTCGSPMVGAGGYGLCKLAAGHAGSHLEGEWKQCT